MRDESAGPKQSVTPLFLGTEKEFKGGRGPLPCLSSLVLQDVDSNRRFEVCKLYAARPHYKKRDLDLVMSGLATLAAVGAVLVSFIEDLPGRVVVVLDAGEEDWAHLQYVLRGQWPGNLEHAPFEVTGVPSSEHAFEWLAREIAWEPEIWDLAINRATLLSLAWDLSGRPAWWDGARL